jgi:hypothetical protein
VGDGEKLLKYLNSALKLVSGLDIFPRGKKKVNFVDQCYVCVQFVGYKFKVQRRRYKSTSEYIPTKTYPLCTISAFFY